MPKKGSYIEFRNFHKKMRAPLTIYYDCESVNIRCCTKVGQSTTIIFKQRLMSVKANAVWSDGKEDPSPIFYSEKAIDQFLDWTLENVKELDARIEFGYINYHNIKITEEQKKAYAEAKTCMCCTAEFSENNDKVMHHDSVSGNYIGAICLGCKRAITCILVLQTAIYQDEEY